VPYPYSAQVRTSDAATTMVRLVTTAETH